MIESQRQAYLEAMDINVWVCKPGTDDSLRLILGPGGGSALLLCRDTDEQSVAIGADIGRFLGGDPVWAWPDPDNHEQNPELKAAVHQHLFTRVVIFGASLAERLFGGTEPPVVGSARIIVSADLDELALSGGARKALWGALTNAGPVDGK